MEQALPSHLEQLDQKKEKKNTLHGRKLVLPSHHRREHHLGELKVGPGNECTFGGGVVTGVY